MNIIAARLQTVKAQIAAAEQRYQLASGCVKLIAVSKGHSVEKINQAVAAGQRCFGENYAQEALAKITTVSEQKLEWHFIGVIQSNKTKMIAENFSWVHSVASFKIAKRLHEQRPADLPPLNICIEINTCNEKTKSGIALSELKNLAFEIVQLSRLKLRGLMTIPLATDNFAQQRIPYQKLRLALEQLCEAGIALDTLSMGMSHDFTAAIAEGSTMVRIGTAIFGQREN